MTSRQKRKLTEFLFLLPTLIAFLMVIIIPFIFGIYYSFTDWQGTGAVNRVVGFENYKAIFQEPGFLHSFLVTLLFTVLNIITVNVVAFLISLLVTSEIRGRNIYRAGFFVPNLIGGIVLGLVWQFIFSNILPSVGQSLGLPTLSKSLISNKDTVMITLVTVNTWQYAGYIMLIYVASIQGISKSVMEAAEVDGARYWTRVRKIQIPLMANAFTISLFLTLTNSFKMYDVNVALTNGGPVSIFMMKPVQASELLALNIYNTAFKYNNMAQGQAKAVIFFIVLTIFSVIQVTWNKSKEVEA
ncbi:carbohydrate ABC transporter permease [Aristaeella hokkaidonensis]|jgi:raffinose/stachyose/melibiose transport system permease protein|uniref:Sugar ABC transporter permease n=1 Tax=Aristaeella hokkaidonensis TaxID=3046382 RepID=A0AC61NKF6_9FIRM|nr:sugar ABC transporter permease [Aristaeella hokkaidonensis]QUC66578.1 sugar ABC transporter permease [Aristaeella hokkaidonensis]SNT95166.1 carbohydrate ABC transporter membrane protein 1, CUT1 family [Aristaeella hokkaidonensis]